MVAAASCVLAQDTTSQRVTYTYDLNGRREPVARQSASGSSTGSSSAQAVQSVNGREAPLEKVEERVISSGPDGKVVERIVRKFDATGLAAGSEKLLIEERKTSDGGTTTLTTTYDSNINGGYAMRERTTTQAAKTGDVLRAETFTERPSVNGGLEAWERKVAVTTGTDKDSQRDVTVYRKSATGGFVEAVREITETKVQDGQTTTTVAEYNAASTGKMELAGQKVSRLQKNPDGSELEVVDVYGATSPGRASPGAASPKLREQQVIERKPGTGNTLTETFSVRRTEVDSDRLGSLQKISETVCTGNCKP